jgi:hypothetical protein
MNYVMRKNVCEMYSTGLQIFERKHEPPWFLEARPGRLDHHPSSREASLLLDTRVCLCLLVCLKYKKNLKFQPWLKIKLKSIEK